MNVAYVFSTPNASYILEKMIVPQLEEGRLRGNVSDVLLRRQQLPARAR